MGMSILVIQWSDPSGVRAFSVVDTLPGLDCYPDRFRAVAIVPYSETMAEPLSQESGSGRERVKHEEQSGPV